MTGKELLPLIHAKGRGDRMSENLYKWVRKRGAREIGAVFSGYSRIDGSPVAYDPAKTQSGNIIIVTNLDDDGWSYGSRLSCIIGGAAKETFAYGNKEFQITPLPEWWQGYINGGKCFIDPEHRLYHDRWQVSEDGKSRHCKWCGGHLQERRTEMVPREYWASVTDLVMRGEGS